MENFGSPVFFPYVKKVGKKADSRGVFLGLWEEEGGRGKGEKAAGFEKEWSQKSRVEEKEERRRRETFSASWGEREGGGGIRMGRRKKGRKSRELKFSTTFPFISHPHPDPKDLFLSLFLSFAQCFVLHRG